MVQPGISHYEILRKVGEGGMGRVYEAHDRTLGRSVALKFLSPGLVGSPEQVARFKREARAISALNHPNIATIHGFEETDGSSYLVLEFLPGGTLAEKLEELKRTKQIPRLDQALDWGIQVAEGLQHAHAHGVIHRDIKASNVMFTEDGRPKICDFGLASLRESGDVTTAGRILGTPPSMSPEQVQGQDVDHRSDIFSFGVLLYRLLTGEMPFRGGNPAAVMHEIVYGEPPPMDQLRDSIPLSVQTAVSRTLKKKREERYQSMAELLADLKSARRDVASASTEETITLPRLRRWKWASYRFVALGMVLAVLLAAVILTRPARQLIASRLHSTPLPAEKRIAVLPFSTKDDSNKAFAEGLNSTLSFKLAQLEQFHGSLVVVEAREIIQKDVRLPSAAREKFAANLAVVGDLMRTEDQVQALVRLVDTKDLVYLRTANIVAFPSEMTAFRDRIVNGVAQMLDLQLTEEAQQTLRRGETEIATAYTHYVEGVGYLQRYDRTGNIAKAETAFKESLAKDNNYALAHAGIAEAQLRQFNVSKDPAAIAAATASCSRAIELDNSLAPAHVTMGSIQVAKGEYEQAEQEFQTALNLNPLAAEAYRGLASAYEAEQRFDEAEATLKKVIQMRPSDWASYNGLGAFYFRRNSFGDAATYFARARDVTPDNVLAHNNLGAVYLKMGRFPDAVEEFQKSLAMETSALAESNLGMAYHLQERYSEAAVHAENASKITPDKENFAGNLAWAYYWDPQTARKAPEAFKHAIQLGEVQRLINPRDPELLSRVATYWAALGEKTKSRSEIQRALKLAPSSGYVLYRAAVVYDFAGDRRRALNAVQSALENGYSLVEIQHAPALKNLRQDRRFNKLLEARLPAGAQS